MYGLASGAMERTSTRAAELPGTYPRLRLGIIRLEPRTEAMEERSNDPF